METEVAMISQRIKVISVLLVITVGLLTTVYITKEDVFKNSLMKNQKVLNSSRENVDLLKLDPNEKESQERRKDYTKELNSWELQKTNKSSIEINLQEKKEVYINKLFSYFNNSKNKEQVSNLIKTYSPASVDSSKALIEYLILKKETNFALEGASLLLQSNPSSKEARDVYASTYKTHVQLMKKHQEKIIAGGNS